MDYKLNKNNVEDILVLTPMQHGILFQCVSNPKHNLYFTQLEVDFRGYFNFNLIKLAWSYIVRDNDIFRSVFRWENLKQPIQIILNEKEIPIQLYDLTEFNYEIKQKAICKIKQKATKMGVDIRVNPIAVIICRISEDRWKMIINNNHILYDGWSNAIIIREFLENYKGATCC